MNTFSGHISNIEISGSLSIVSITIDKHIVLQAIVVETPETATYLQKENSIAILFKETEVIIAVSDVPTTSIQNIIRGVIIDIKEGGPLSKVIIDTSIGEIVSVIASQSIEKLQLSIGKKVLTMIQMNEIMLVQ